MIERVAYMITNEDAIKLMQQVYKERRIKGC